MYDSYKEMAIEESYEILTLNAEKREMQHDIKRLIEEKQKLMKEVRKLQYENHLLKEKEK